MSEQLASPSTGKQNVVTTQDEEHTSLPRMSFLPAKPHCSLYDSTTEASMEYALPALARQHALKLAGVGPTSSIAFTPAPAALSASTAAAISRTLSFPHQSGPTPPSLTNSGLTGPASAASLSATTQLATMGVGVGPGINPNISNPSSNTTNQGSVTSQNNPPIINTGNNGPMYVQPGDWVCSGCGFVNWRRRRVCMRCYPFADSNEMSKSIANGALLAAQLAAGYNPPAEMMASLAQPRRNTVSSMPSAPYAYDAQSVAPAREYVHVPAQHGPTSRMPMAMYGNLPTTWHAQAYDSQPSTTDAMLARMADSRLTMSSPAQYPSNVSALHQNARAPSFQPPTHGFTNNGVKEHSSSSSSGGGGQVDMPSTDAQRWMDETMSHILGATQASSSSASVTRPPLSHYSSSRSERNASHTIIPTPSVPSPQAVEWGVSSLSSMAQHANAAPFKSVLSSSSAPFQMAADRNVFGAAAAHLHSHGPQSQKSTSISSSPSRSPTIPRQLSASAAEFTITPILAPKAADGTSQYVSATDEKDEIVQPAWTGTRRRANLASQAPAPTDVYPATAHLDCNDSLASEKNRQAAIQPPGSRKDCGSTTASISSWNSSSKSSLTSLLE